MFLCFSLINEGGDFVEIRLVNESFTLDENGTVEIRKYRKYEIEIEFISPIDSDQLVADAVVQLKLNNLIVPLKVPKFKRDACINSGIQCPLVKDQRYVYIYKISIAVGTIGKQYATIEWKLSDAKSKMLITCFRLNVKTI